MVYSLKLFLSYGLLFYTPFIVASTGVDITDSDTTNTLSESLDTETLEARSVVPAEYCNTCDLRRMRENLQQAQKARHPRAQRPE